MRSTARGALAAVTVSLASAFGIGLASSAYAANASVELSSLDPNTAVSGSATAAWTGVDKNVVGMRLDFPKADYTVQVTGTSGQNYVNLCQRASVVLKLNTQTVNYSHCIIDDYGTGTYYMEVYLLSSSRQSTASDVITLSWGSSLVTTRAGGAGAINVAPNGAEGQLISPTVAAADDSIAASTEPGPNRTVWLQSIERAHAEAACPSGYAPSWAAWASAGRGGFVCNRSVYAYGDEPYSAS